MSKIAAMVGLAACAIGAGMATTTRARSGCALVAAACAGWLAGEAAAMSRQRSMLKGDGKENQSKAKRKKKEQEARENEPAHTQEAMVRDYEPAVKKGKTIVRENEPAVEEKEEKEKRIKRFTTQRIEGKKNEEEWLRAGWASRSRQGVDDVFKVYGEEGPRVGSGCFQSLGKAPVSGKVCDTVVMAQNGRVIEAYPSHGSVKPCFTTGVRAAPIDTATPRVKAMSLRPGQAFGKSGAAGSDASGDQLLFHCLNLLDLGLYPKTW